MENVYENERIEILLQNFRKTENIKDSGSNHFFNCAGNSFLAHR